jgi:hypothetical protein
MALGTGIYQAEATIAGIDASFEYVRVICGAHGDRHYYRRGNSHYGNDEVPSLGSDLHVDLLPRVFGRRQSIVGG